jgi:hypothetical protein
MTNTKEKRQIFEKYIGKRISITLKPNNFLLTGEIDYIFDDGIQFKTQQKTSYLDFDIISSVQEE